MSEKIPKRAWRLMEHLPSLFLGFGAISIAGLFLISHHDLVVTSLAKAFPTWAEYGWLTLLLIGGIACLAGVLTKNIFYETAGLMLVGAAFIIDFWCIIADRSVAGFLSGGLILLAGLRMWFEAFVLNPRRDYPSKDSYPQDP